MPTVLVSTTSKQLSSKTDVNVFFNHVATHGKCDVYETDSGVFEFSYCGTRRGQHKLSVEVNGRHINTFPVLVTLPLNMLGKPVRVIEHVHSPTSMAISSNDILVVNETGSTPRLVVMNKF